MSLNQSLRETIAKTPSVFFWWMQQDSPAGLALRAGTTPALWYLARAGIHPKLFPALAKLIARGFAALRRPAAKCVVLDLDNTAWGGILGKAGFERIHCGDGDYPGNASASLKRFCIVPAGTPGTA